MEKRIVPEEEIPEIVDMAIKLIILENIRKVHLAGNLAKHIKMAFDSLFIPNPDDNGHSYSIPVNPFKLVKKDKGRPSRGNSAVLEPYGKVRGQIWLN